MTRHAVADLRDELDRARSEARRATERAEGAERERDQLRIRLRAATYGGPVNARLESWRDALDVIDRIDADALAVAIGQARDAHLRSSVTNVEGRRPLLVCDIHDIDLTDCHREGWFCVGSHVDVATDRTGDSASRSAMKTDAASADLSRLTKAHTKLTQVANTLMDLHRRYAINPANAYQRTTTTEAPGCTSCARLPITLQDGSKVTRWSPIFRDALCRWCYDWRRKTDTAPPLDKLRSHHDGTRVMVKG
jgi:hypothetical protein